MNPPIGFSHGHRQILDDQLPEPDASGTRILQVPLNSLCPIPTLEQDDRQIGLAWRQQSARSEAFIEMGHLLRDWAAANVKAFKER
ncbi:hypothetical protein [Rhodopseudomonas pseudopalustris]|uniref:Uncharacterized protein n=1 Tax=Rhodopseudomonas pseudopalustris TaxID=1513892 RepID=A0A1H8VIU1_9BRAD|nr:hypothetical protein [Rhodopseudomonas pseudopalustris]SEP15372.1 hypothetical protein SAMN05444123_10912 [Rhodopseudomonas pseudopalustris]